MTIEEIEIIRKALDTEETHKDYIKNVTNAKTILNKEEKAISVTRCCKSDSEQLKTFNIHQCINEIGIEANRCDGLFYDISKDKSFRYNVKKAIDKMLYSK